MKTSKTMNPNLVAMIVSIVAGCLITYLLVMYTDLFLDANFMALVTLVINIVFFNQTIKTFTIGKLRPGYFLSDKNGREVLLENKSIELIYYWSWQYKDSCTVQYIRDKHVWADFKATNKAFKGSKCKFGILFSENAAQTLLLHQFERINNTSIEETIQYWLYEFSRKHVSDMERFYNPISKDQQDEFSNLVQIFLKPYLKRLGGYTANASFT